MMTTTMKANEWGIAKKKCYSWCFIPMRLDCMNIRSIKRVCVCVCVCVNLRVSIIRSMIIHSRPLSLSSFVSHYEYNPFSSITYHP